MVLKSVLLPLSFILICSTAFISSDSDPGDASARQTVTFDIRKEYQSIEGFGSCIVNYKDFPPEYSDPAFFDRVVNDLGLSIVRVPLMEHTEYVNDDDDPDHFNWKGFWLGDNINRKGLDSSMWLMQQFKKHGVKRFMGTPWSPPDFMKTTRAPIRGGFLRADMFDEYAEYMAAQIILAKKDYGIDLNWVSMQNELLFPEFYRSCVYNPWVTKEAVRALMHKFEKEDIHTQILMPEDMMYTGRMLYNIAPTMADKETRNFNGQFCTHRKGGKEDLTRWMAETNQYHRQNWMTETSGHDQTWQGAMKMASDIQDYLVYGNFSAWIYWQLSGGEGNQGRFAIMVNGQPGPKYYASKQFYRYIRPGAVRVKASTPDERLSVSAFHHPVDGTLTLVVINNSEDNIRSGLDSDYKFDIYQSTISMHCEKTGVLKPGKKVKFPAHSITTLQTENRKLKTLKEMPQLPESWNVPARVKDEIWGNTNPFPRKHPYQISPDGGNKSAWPTVKNLINSGTLDKEMHNGWTPLFTAILNGDGDAVKLLIDGGANVNAKADDGWTPLDMASATFTGNHEKDNRLKDYTKYDIFKLVLDAGADVNATTRDGWTPLHAAVANAMKAWREEPEWSLKRISDLVDAGANIEARDDNGRTPLHWAAMQGFYYYTWLPEVHADVVKLLIDEGAKIDVTDKYGETPLQYAVQMGYPDIVVELVKRGASLTRKDNEGLTAMDIAVKNGVPEVIYILKNGEKMDDGKDMAETSSDGNNRAFKYGPELLKAAWAGDVDKVKELLDKGADVNYHDSDGFTALERARDNGHKKIVEMLNNAGAVRK